jgi:hypothetical protein
MAGSVFDPIQIEDQLVKIHELPPLIASDHGALGETERFFTEDDRRLHALWRISMVRQLHPEVLHQLTDHDLLYLAAQSSDGYEENPKWGIDHVRNKIEQNTLRARVEIERRSRQAAFAQSLLVGSLSALVGAVLGVAMGHWLR